jgi:AraC family transcriptional regulator
MSVTGKALWYIEAHLESELSLESVADVAAVSRFHLCRAFAASTGNSIAGYVRARRLSEAAKALASGAPDILAIALEAGYGSHEAFTRAFRQHFGITPEQVRSRASLDNLKLQEPIRMKDTHIAMIDAPRIVPSEAMLIFGLAERWKTNAAIPAQWNRFLPHFGNIENQMGSEAYGVIYNSDDSGKYDYLCGVQVSEFPARPAEFTRLRIPPQTYAVFEHRGHVSEIAATWKAIWENALAASGNKVADGAAFEKYLKDFDGRTGRGGMEIWVPVSAGLTG